MVNTTAVASTEAEQAPCILRLYVAGSTPQSSRAIQNLKAICEANLPDRYVLTVVDLYAQPERAREEQIVVAPTLIRQSPLPIRRVVGDMSNTARVLAALDLPRALPAS
ncbi:MAG: circadian clock KaiB family protein [Chthoniobacterales bacterium]